MRGLRSHLAGLTDDDVDFWFVVCTHGSVLDLPHHEHPVDNPAEHDVFAVQEVTLGCRDEKLAAVAVFPTVGHRELAWLGVFEGEVFISEGGAGVYRHAASPVTVDKVPALNHEVLDDAVEVGAFVAQWDTVLPVLSCAELPEILSRLGNNISEQFLKKYT